MNWFFNTDEGEPEGKGAYERMLGESCIALWAFKGRGDPFKKLSCPAVGDRVFFYLNGIGFIATGLISDEGPVRNDRIFRKGVSDAFSRQVIDLISIANPKCNAITPAEVQEMGGKLSYLHALCRIKDARVAEALFVELESRGDPNTKK